MAHVRNAFKIRAADSPIVETSQFIQLYCPVLLNQLEHDELLVPKLIVVRGTPGSGKSSLLRLFETDTLMALHARRSQPVCLPLVERLSELGVVDDKGPRAVGVHIQCDSGLRDVANLGHESETAGLFNSLLDTRIVSAFLRGLVKLKARLGPESVSDTVFEPLSADVAPPAMFAERRNLSDLTQLCARVERDFGALLNSFPEDPRPPTIQPHARVYSLTYLGLQREKVPQLSEILPIVMLDDVQELYPEQRTQLEREFIRRSGIPRWLSMRTQVFGLEKLISLEGAENGRDFQELDLDRIFQEKTGVFGRFATNVVDRRLSSTESLRPIDIEGFKELLRPGEELVSQDKARSGIQELGTRIAEIGRSGRLDLTGILRAKEEIEGKLSWGARVDDLASLEEKLILVERQARRSQRALFPVFEAPESGDAKTREAALLFVSHRLGLPYYVGFDALVSLASHNVQQLLSIMAAIVDRMIYRADLGREKALLPKQQEEILKRLADDYFNALEEGHRSGTAIKRFVDNLGRFSKEVTYRANAPIAPGVNGFGVTPEELRRTATAGAHDPDSLLMRQVLTNAVAGNVLSVRVTKQGQAGSDKIVFYLNRILCIRYDLPLSYGGWQPISTPILARMMKAALAPKDIGRRGGRTGHLLDDVE